MKVAKSVFVILGLALLIPAAHAQEQLWIEQIGTTTGEEEPRFARDAAGGFYMGGSTHGTLGGPSAGSSDVWLSRYDGDGNQLWIRQFGTGGWDQVNALAPDGAGGAMVAGSTEGSLGGPNAGPAFTWDVFIARYDGAGNQLWILQFGTSGSEQASSLVPDGAGGVMVAGFTNGNLGGPNAGGDDAFLARYDGAGNRLWIRQFGTSGDDYAKALAPDGASGAFIGGHTTGALAGPNAGAADVWFARYDADGNRLWIDQPGTPASEWVEALAPDASGGFFAGGGKGAARCCSPSHVWLGRFDGQGNQVWIDEISSDRTDRVEAMASDGAGGVLLCGGTEGVLVAPGAGGVDIWLAQYGADGTQTWITQFGTSAHDMARGLVYDGAGGMFVGGGTDGSLGGANIGQCDIWFARYAGDSCYADCDPNGVLDIFDFLCFQNSFVAGEPYACDCDPNPACNIFDFLCFQNAFVGGCP